MMFQLMLEKRFSPFFWTQFSGAFNDNLYKNALIIFIAFQPAENLPFDANTLNNFCAGIFILPFLVFSPIAGQIADKFEKSKMIQRVKSLEILIMGLAVIGFYLQNLAILITILFLMGIQSTLFGPVKYSYLPQHLSKNELTGGTSLVSMGTFFAILMGTILSGILFEYDHKIFYVSFAVLVTALGGWLFSLFIPATRAADPDIQFDFHWFRQSRDLMGIVKKEPTVMIAIIGISWFWLYGALFLTQLPNYTAKDLGGTPLLVTVFFAIFSLGIGLGALLCNRLSSGHIEKGLVPLGALGLTVFSIDLLFATPALHTGIAQSVQVFMNQSAHWRIIIDLICISLAGGIYIVPLYAVMQYKSPLQYRSRVIAANNILNAVFILAGAIMSMVVLGSGFSIPQLFCFIGILNIIFMLYLLRRDPEYFQRFKARFWLG